LAGEGGATFLAGTQLAGPVELLIARLARPTRPAWSATGLQRP